MVQSTRSNNYRQKRDSRRYGLAVLTPRYQYFVGGFPPGVVWFGRFRDGNAALQNMGKLRNALKLCMQPTDGDG